MEAAGHAGQQQGWDGPGSDLATVRSGCHIVVWGVWSGTAGPHRVGEPALIVVRAGVNGHVMARILVINPEQPRLACTAGIDERRWRRSGLRGGPAIDVVGLPEGPPAILSWRDWHGVVEPLCRRVESGARRMPM